MPIHVDNLIHTTYELPRLLKLQVIYKLDKAKPTRMHFIGLSFFSIVCVT